MAASNPLEDPLGHTIDNDYIHLPGEVAINVHDATGRIMGDLFAWAGIHGLTKFMVLMLASVVILLLILIPMATSFRRYGYAKGLLANAIEAVCVFVRDTAAVPALGKDAHHFLPYLWTVFFFILINNLLGLIPWLGSATGALGVTSALALCSLVLIHGSGIFHNGVVGYAKSIVPHGVPAAFYLLMLVIELVSHVVRPTVLALRLFVNMVAGHTVLFVILSFIAVTAGSIFYYVVAPMSVVGVVIFTFLELLVAFLQAYVFTLLSAVFIGAAVHPSH